MLVEKISSRQNPLVKRFRKVRAGGEPHLILIEGIRLLEEALAVRAHFETVAFTTELESSDRGVALQDALRRVPCRGAQLSKQVMDYIAGTESPQGVAAIVSRPHFTLNDIFAESPQLIVVADALQDPGNLGTIVRTAEAAGATGLITTPGAVSPYNSKAVRASMGSALRFPIATHVKWSEAHALARALNVKTVIARIPRAGPKKSGLASELYTKADFALPVAIVLGNEGGGVSEEIIAAADMLVHIPMAAGVDSLNVAAAGSVLLYEATRQRRRGAGSQD
ncbi:MAG TPA: RNA methyltransferase [Blastocatellia bacterium]|nr:RNA methyltransferase [Blastocatellia bacterium]